MSTNRRWERANRKADENPPVSLQWRQDRLRRYCRKLRALALAEGVDLSDQDDTLLMIGVTLRSRGIDTTQPIPDEDWKAAMQTVAQAFSVTLPE
jgi:hypothetical protein